MPASKSKIVDVHIYLMSLQTSNYSGQTRRGESNWKGVSPIPSRLGDLGSVVSSLSGSRAELQSQTIFGRFVCYFMQFHASFRAFNSCLEMGDSYIHLFCLLWLVGLIFPCNFWGVGHPNFNFLTVVISSIVPSNVTYTPHILPLYTVLLYTAGPTV